MAVSLTGVGSNVFRTCRRYFFPFVQVHKVINKDCFVAAAALNFHTSCTNLKKNLQGGFPAPPKKWPAYNDVIYPPQKEDEPRRPAWVCHMRHQIKYSPDKMMYIAAMIRGMSVDEAVTQLTFCKKKGAQVVKEVLLEAQELAVKEHNVEYKSNLWVAESFVGNGNYIKGLRRHARKRFAIVLYKYCHYFVRLEEGPPPPFYYQPPMTGHQKLQDWLEQRRSRVIQLSL